MAPDLLLPDHEPAFHCTVEIDIHLRSSGPLALIGQEVVVGGGVDSQRPTPVDMERSEVDI